MLTSPEVYYEMYLQGKTEKEILCPKCAPQRRKNTILQQSGSLEASKPKRKTNVAALKERLRRLNVMYKAGNMPDDEYVRESTEIKGLIAKAEEDAPPVERDLEPLKQFLSKDFRNAYEKLDPENRRLIWRGVIKEIIVEKMM